MRYRLILAGLLFAAPQTAEARPKINRMVIEERIGGNIGVGPFSQYFGSYSYGVSAGMGADKFVIGPFIEGTGNHIRHAPGSIGHNGAEFYDAKANSIAVGFLVEHDTFERAPWRIRTSFGVGLYQMSYWQRCIDRSNGAGCNGFHTMQRSATTNNMGLSVGAQFLWKWLGFEVRYHRLTGGTRVPSQAWIMPAIIVTGDIF
jgi:hypothetical protein